MGPIEGRRWPGPATATTSPPPGSMRPRSSGSSWRSPARRSSIPRTRSSTGPKRNGADIVLTDDPAEAVTGADCVVTDTWVSMGQRTTRRGASSCWGPMRSTTQLMKKAAPGAIFMHCLPAYRGHEVTAAVIDGPQSVVWDEAENRLHAQKAILAWCLGVD